MQYGHDEETDNIKHIERHQAIQQGIYKTRLKVIEPLPEEVRKERYHSPRFILKSKVLQGLV